MINWRNLTLSRYYDVIKNKLRKNIKKICQRQNRVGVWHLQVLKWPEIVKIMTI